MPTTCHAPPGTFRTFTEEFSKLRSNVLIQRNQKREIIKLTKKRNVGFLRYGGLAVLLQTSPESADIFVMLQRIFRKQTPSTLAQVATAAGLSSEEYQVHTGL